MIIKLTLCLFAAIITTKSFSSTIRMTSTTSTMPQAREQQVRMNIMSPIRIIESMVARRNETRVFREREFIREHQRNSASALSSTATAAAEISSDPDRRYRYLRNVNSSSMSWLNTSQNVITITSKCVEERLGDRASVFDFLAQSPAFESCIPEALDQGSLPTCTANAVTALLMCVQNETSRNERVETEMLSRLYLDWHARSLEDRLCENSGVSIVASFRALYQYSISSEEIWPYIESQFLVEPNEAAKSSAEKNKCLYNILKIAKLEQNLSVLKYTIRMLRRPFVLGIKIFESFDSAEVVANGMVPMPQAGLDGAITEKCFGGHAMLAIDFDDNLQCFIVLNSYGSSFPNKGRLLLPYSYIEDENLAFDFTTLV